MNLETYKSKVVALKKDHEIELRELALEFANSNSTIKIGDFFTDNIGTIKVETVGLCTDPRGPSFVFFGAEYTKKLKPFKSGSERSAYQRNAV